MKASLNKVQDCLYVRGKPAGSHQRLPERHSSGSSDTDPAGTCIGQRGKLRAAEAPNLGEGSAGAARTGAHRGNSKVIEATRSCPLGCSQLWCNLMQGPFLNCAENGLQNNAVSKHVEGKQLLAASFSWVLNCTEGNKEENVSQLRQHKLRYKFQYQATQVTFNYFAYILTYQLFPLPLNRTFSHAKSLMPY